MNGITTSWKIFRAASIIQLILVVLQLLLSILDLFYGPGIGYAIAGIIVYALIFYFVYHGLSLINYNFPDTPLTPKQKQTFNRLFVVNFIIIAYLFARVLNNWYIVPLVMEVENIKFSSLLAVLFPFISATLVFILHLVFLGGMVQLRRVIHQNTLNSWYNQFDDSKQEEQ